MRLIATTAALNAFREAQVGESVQLAYYKIGEGGWYSLNGTRLPRAPSADLTDLDCIENPSRYPVGSRRTYQKDIASESIIHTETGQITIACEIDTNEGNSSGDVNPPEYYEIGVFTADDVMMYYCTFPKLTKLSDRAYHLDLTATMRND